LRRYEEAMLFCDRATALATDPTIPSIQKINLFLKWRGSTVDARQYIRSVANNEHETRRRLGPWEIEVYVQLDLCDGDFDSALRHLSSVDFDIIDNQWDYLPVSLLYAETYRLMGKVDSARVWYDTTVRLLEAKVLKYPNDPRLHGSLAVAYAGLDRKKSALNEAQRATELMPMSLDAWRANYYLINLAQVRTMVGEYDKAIDLLDHLLSVPGEISAPLLALDPRWAPLRDVPRFRKLLEKHTQQYQ